MSYFVLQNASAADLQIDPFPHIVIHNAIPDKLCDQLIERFPESNIISKGADLGDNQRFNYTSADLLKNDAIDSCWKQYVAENASQVFYDRFYEIFEEPLLKHYPFLTKDLKIGLWKRDSGADAYINVAADINSPVKIPSSQRGPHLDQPNKLLFGLLYMRHHNDDSKGGGLEFYRFKDPATFRFSNRGRHIDRAYIELVKTLSYDRNVFVLGLNTISSIHAVEVRETTHFTRCFSNVFIELRRSLFDPDTQTSC